jgi:hypothetical protein
VIQIDSREKKFEHVTQALDQLGVKWFVSKLPVGDYADFDRPRVVIDRKQNLQELVGNVCQEHERFRRELLRARDLDVKLLFLVEHGDSISDLEHVRHWRNPRCAVSPYAMEGWELYRRLVSIENKYGTTFYFCTKEQTGSKIIEILGGTHGIRS